jgi:hypothetical protein
MNKLKIIKIVFLGFILLNLPFVSVIFFVFKYSEVKDFLLYTLIFISVMFFYWSYFTPLYKYYSIKKLINNKEFDYWYVLSNRGLILCPEKSFFEKFEFWDKKKLSEYKKNKKKLTQNYVL